jgi:phosphate transport system protein
MDETLTRGLGDPVPAGGTSVAPRFGARHALRDQENLWDEFLAMGLAVVDSLAKSVAVLCDGFLDDVPEIKRLEKDSESAEARIEHECLRVLALFEPVASDLRRLATVLKVSRDWERIADLAARIARRARKLARSGQGIPVPEPLKSMARDVLAQVRAGYDALAARDAQRARAVIDGDRAIDCQYRRLRSEFKESLRQHAGQLDAWLELLSTARHLERIADHANEIAEMTVYLQEGVIIRHDTQFPAANE